MRFQTDEFVLDVPGEWEQLVGDDPDQFVFESQELRTAIVASCLYAAIPREKMLRGAQTAVNSAIGALDQSGLHRLDENFAEMLDDPPPMAHWKLAGQTKINTYRQEGWVTETKFLNLWVGVEGKDEARATKILDDVFAGFSFYVP